MDKIQMVGPAEEGTALIKEERTYTASADDIQRNLDNLRFEKRNLINQSKDLAERFQRLSNQEDQLQVILDSLTGAPGASLEGPIVLSEGGAISEP